MPEAAKWFADFETGGGIPIPTLLDAGGLARRPAAGGGARRQPGDGRPVRPQRRAARPALPVHRQLLPAGPDGQVRQPDLVGERPGARGAGRRRHLGSAGADAPEAPAGRRCSWCPAAATRTSGPHRSPPGTATRLRQSRQPRRLSGRRRRRRRRRGRWRRWPAVAAGTDTKAPNTTLASKPIKRSRNRQPTFTFRSSEAGSNSCAARSICAPGPVAARRTAPSSASASTCSRCARRYARWSSTRCRRAMRGGLRLRPLAR